MITIRTRVLGSLVGAIFGLIVGEHLLAQDQPPDPANIRGWTNRIERALMEGKSDVALQEINKAIEQAPLRSQLYLIRGSLLFRSGKSWIHRSSRTFGSEGSRCTTRKSTRMGSINL